MYYLSYVSLNPLADDLLFIDPTYKIPVPLFQRISTFLLLSRSGSIESVFIQEWTRNQIPVSVQFDQAR